MKEIYSAISAVMAEINPIAKNRDNKLQNYKFRGIDDIYLAVNEPFVKHGIFCVPTVLSSAREERQSKQGGLLIYAVLTVKYTFYAKDGSSLEAIVCGEAMDSADKASNKAMSAAMKYALLQIFAIPTEEQKDVEYFNPDPTPKSTRAQSTIHSGADQGPSPSSSHMISNDKPVVPFGRSKGMLLSALGAKELMDDLAYWESREKAEGKPLTKSPADYVMNIKRELASRSKPATPVSMDPPAWVNEAPPMSNNMDNIPF